VKLKDHLNRVVGQADSLEEARAKRTQILQGRDTTRKAESESFYLCENCKTKYFFQNVTLTSKMKPCTICGQIAVVYEISKDEPMLKPSKPQTETELSDGEKAEGVSVNEAGYKVGKDGVVIED
jgi:transcription initiation factor IIE alpha subunit